MSAINNNNNEIVTTIRYVADGPVEVYQQSEYEVEAGEQGLQVTAKTGKWSRFTPWHNIKSIFQEIVEADVYVGD